MPLQELSAPPPVTGYAQLGQQLANFGQQARAERLKTADEERQVALEQTRHERGRTEQLADVGSARQWEVATEDRRAKQAAILVLINEGFLNADDKDNEQAIKVAQLAFQQSGLVKKYQMLLTTPDENGEPLLARDDLGNIQKVKEAEIKLQGIAAKENLRLRQEPAKAEAMITGLQQRLDRTSANVDRLQQEASAPLKEYSDSDPMVYEAAKRLAESQKPGSGKNVQAVQARIPDVLKDLNARAFADWKTRTDAAKIQLESERYRAIALTTALDHAMQIFKQAGTVTAPTEQPPSPLAAPTSGMMGAGANPVADFVARQAPPAAPPLAAAPAPLRTQLTPDVIQRSGATPADLALVDRGDAAGATALRKTTLQDPLVQETRDLQALQGQLAQVRTRKAASFLGYTPEQQAQDTTRLLQAIAAKGQRIKELTDQLSTPTTADVSTPTAASTGSLFGGGSPVLQTQLPSWLAPGPNQ